jgi:MATE family multidrug resistance protein
LSNEPKAVPPIADLTSGERVRHVLNLSVPIILALSSQNVLNIVDTWIVGQLGSAELGAVALSSTSNWVLSSFFIGLGAGVQAIVSRRVGDGNLFGAVGALNQALRITVLAVVPLSVIFALLSGPLLELISSQDTIVSVGTPYLAARLYGIPFVAANFAFRGYWNGLSMSKVYLRTLLAIHAVNIVLSYLLVFGVGSWSGMGVVGAGIGSTFAQAVGCAYYCYLAKRLGVHDGFLKGLYGVSLRKLLRLGAPAGAQMIFFSLGFLIFFIITDRIGTSEIAASQVLVTMALVSILPAVGFGLGAASLVGQALGADRRSDARVWGWISLRMGCMLAGAIGVIELVAAPQLMHLFIGQDPAAAAVGVMPLRIIGGIMIIDSIGVILSNAAMGAGATRLVLLISVGCQYGIFLPLAFYLGLVAQLGLTSLWAAFAFYRFVFGGIMLIMWRSNRWQQVDV